MADYEIVIKDDTVTKKSPIAQKTQSESVQDTGRAKAKENVAEYFAFKRIVSPFVRMGIEYGISTVSIRTGRTETQQRMQFAYSVGSKAFGTVENIAIGAAVGGLWGAVAGAVMSTVTTVAGYAINQAKINLSAASENISIGLINARAGGNVAATSGSRRI